jgi:periplasmic protein CpxP/Spy
MMKLHTKLTLGLISSLFAANLAMAVGPGAKMNRHHAGMDCNDMSMMSGDMKMNPVDRADKHLTELNAKLNLTADQQPAWQTFSNHVKEQAKKMGTKRGMMKAPEHMAKMANLMKEKAEHMAKMAEVVKTFYATLTPAQQSAFDMVHESHMAGMR